MSQVDPLSAIGVEDVTAAQGLRLPATFVGRWHSMIVRALLGPPSGHQRYEEITFAMVSPHKCLFYMPRKQTGRIAVMRQIDGYL